jgi:predicted lipid carrier protein YhbT
MDSTKMDSHPSSAPDYPEWPRFVLAPVPLPLVQPLLARIARHVAVKQPSLFARLAGQTHKAFVIDPVNMPFAMILRPDPEKPVLRAVRRPVPSGCDARIRGSFLKLLDMIDGRLDGDALFFSRDLTITGDTQAIVSLRNALDDQEGSIAAEVAAMFGPPGRAALSGLREIREAQ